MDSLEGPLFDFFFIDNFMFVHVSRKAFSISKVILKMPKYICKEGRKGIFREQNVYTYIVLDNM